MLTLLLLGIMPTGDLPVGPPNTISLPDPSTQVRLSPLAREFRKEWGPAAIRWDQATATPHFVYLSGVAIHEADALMADLARLARVDPSELQHALTTEQDNTTIIRFDRFIDGAPVFQNQIAVVAKDGRIGAAWVRLHPGSPDTMPQPDEIWVVVDRQLTPTTRSEIDGVVRHTDRRGHEVLAWSNRYHAELQVEAYERTIGDSMVALPARQVTVDDGKTSDVTDDAGFHSHSGPVDVTLTGPALTVADLTHSTTVATKGDATLVGGTDLSMAAAILQTHTHVGRDWLLNRWPTHDWLTEAIGATVNEYGSCNAYYSGGQMVFYDAGGSCNNFGEIADVVYHEMGHGIHHYILASGTFAGDISEGSADYISGTILDDPVLAPYARTDGDYIREIDTDRIYPAHANGEVHNDGLIWASFLWNLRQDWRVTYGEEAGIEQTDLLLLGALQQGPALLNAYEAVIVADDDDGDLFNGTPHDCDLASRMGDHGIGPGPLGMLVYDHDPLGPQSSFAHEYPVEFDLSGVLEECSEFDPDTVAVWVAVDTPALPTGGPPSTASTWGDYLRAPIKRVGGQYQAVLPRQFPGTQVHYFISGTTSDGLYDFTTHGGDANGVYSFWVGDRETLACTDFETDPKWTTTATNLDQWERGAPDPSVSYGPDSATRGKHIMATRLGGDYQPNNHQTLASKTFDVSGHGDMLMLSYQRLLSVEDGFYDQATIEVSGTTAWANYASSTWNASDHTIDADWVIHDLPIAEHVGKDGLVDLTWTLTSDGGLEFYGWAMDDVCITQLIADEEHYRVRDVVASDDQEDITITWSQPYFEPLSATMLVRKEGGVPKDANDGDVVDLDLNPALGQRRSVVDEDAVLDQPYTYAVFAAAKGEKWINTGVILGENADDGLALMPSEPKDTGVGPDPGETQDTAEDPGTVPTGADDTATPNRVDGKEGEEKTGCGCATGGASVMWWGLPLLALRRRSLGRVAKP